MGLGNERDEDKEKDRRKLWGLVIPLIVWLFCVVMAIVKHLQNSDGFVLIDWLEIINGNTFSAFISLVAYMIYQFFSCENPQKQEESGLSRKYIWLTILSTIVYCAFTVANLARFNLFTSILALICTIAYIVLFFVYMRTK